MFLSFELEHLRIAAEALKRLEGKDAEEMCGTDLPTPATFETNRDYVTEVLLGTADLRLIPNGDWAKVAELAADWPSRRYQELVNALGAPSESVVTLRMTAAGSELVRTGDKALAQRAGEIRMNSLDGTDAPNTTPAPDGLPTPIEEEVARLGELATKVDDVRVTATNDRRPRASSSDSSRSSRRSPSGAASGRSQRSR
jgi:hypothetical protein